MDSFVKEAFSLLGVGLFIIGLRLYVRISTAGLKGLHVDDYFMVVAAVAYSVETYLAYSVGAFWHGLANNGMTDEQRRLLNPDSDEFRLRVSGSKTQVAGWSTYTFLLWTIKAAMCTFYLRLTEGLGFQKRVYAGFDPINGAEQAGCWAVRETFVAVITSNMPMITPLIARLCRPVIGTLRSTRASAKNSNLTDSANGKAKLIYENKNPRRGMGPRSVNPIPDLTTYNASENALDIRSEETKIETILEDVDLEAGPAATPLSPLAPRGSEMSWLTSAEAVRMRYAEPETSQEFGGYYHARQVLRQAFGTSVYFPTNLVFPLPAALESKLRVFEHPTDSGGTKRCYFCPWCGVRIFNAGVAPDGKTLKPVVAFKAG
ncbi:hypothetical protein N0V88_002744 [Collariella sp. IMI 366227]|nr:hypothetical protein N0V88_002744 [Collariella sp. IMI 366227]